LYFVLCQVDTIYKTTVYLVAMIHGHGHETQQNFKKLGYGDMISNILLLLLYTDKFSHN